MNEKISSVLHDQAGGEIHIERLLSAVHAGARRRRHRRLALTAGAAVVLTALAGATGVVLTRESAPVAGPTLDGGSPRPPAVELPSPHTGPLKTLGTDPTLFHLDLTDLDGLTYVSWSSRSGGHQELAMTTASNADVLIEANRDPDRLRAINGTTLATTVGGEPARAAEVSGAQLIRWQPLPGIWAQVRAETDFQTAIDIAAKLSLDRTYRCAVPFRFDRVHSAHLRKCTTYYTLDEETGRWVPGGGVWFTVGEDDTEYQVEAIGKADEQVVVNATVDGRAMEVVDPAGQADSQSPQAEIRYPYAGWTAYFYSYYTAHPEVLRSLATAYRPVTDDDQRTWPRSPFG